MSEDVAGLYARCLLGTGATRAFRAPGHELPAPAGLEVVDVPDADVAALLADADGCLARSPSAHPGVALLPGRRVRLSSRPGAEVAAHPLSDPAELPVAIGGWTAGRAHAALELDLELDLRAPAPEGLDPLSFAPVDERLTTLSPDLCTLDLVLVVGSGVVRDGHVEGVVEAARRTGAAVVATPGAVGVLDLDDPSWAGVVGLQADDAALAGVADAELLVVAGLDPDEADGVVPDDAQVVEVEPWHLELMAIRWPEPDGAPAGGGRHGALVTRLAEIGTTARHSDAVPLHPARALADLAQVLDADDLLVADVGAAGLWLQRGLVARPAGSIAVPALPTVGFGAAAALVAALDGRRAVAVVVAPADPTTEAILDLAASLGRSLVVEEWTTGVEWSSTSEHRERLVGALHEGGVQRIAVPVDEGAVDELFALAGPLVVRDPTA